LALSQTAKVAQTETAVNILDFILEFPDFAFLAGDDLNQHQYQGFLIRKGNLDPGDSNWIWATGSVLLIH